MISLGKIFGQMKNSSHGPAIDGCVLHTVTVTSQMG